MKKLFAPHWILLSLYFLFSSTFLLFHAAHSLHSVLPYLLIFMPFLLLFWNPSKYRGISGFGIVLLVLFVALHAVPVFPIVQSHHASISHEQHPCCIPQLSDAVVGHISEPFLACLSCYQEQDHTVPYMAFAGPHTTRAPPYIS